MNKIITMNKVIIQLWEESIKHQKSIPDGCTIHIDINERDSFIENIYKSRLNSHIPDRYERIVGSSVEAFVEDDVFNTLQTTKTIKLSQVELNNLVKFEELIIK